MKAIQDFYPDDVAICYGCGRHNEQGHHVRTYWDGTTGIATFTPEDYHTAFPGIVYGGLLASLIDCHAMATATASAHDQTGIALGSEDTITHVTGNLNVNYLKPTPMGVELTLKATIKEITDRKAIVDCVVIADDVETVSATIVAVRVPRRKLSNLD